MRALLVLLAVALPMMAAAQTPAKLGVYLASSPTAEAQTSSFAHYLGRKPEIMGAAVAYDGGWGAFTNPQGDGAFEAMSWMQTNYRLAIGIPMLTTNNPGGDQTLADCASGACDQYYTALGKILIQYGHADAILRVGWEMNCQCWPWRASNDPANWIKLFQRMSTIFRGLPGSHFVIDWNPSFSDDWGTGDPTCDGCGFTAPNPIADAELFWPGAAYVDVISNDVYNLARFSEIDGHRLSPIEEWNWMLTTQRGFNWLAEFAAKQGKPIGFPEWSTGYAAPIQSWGDPSADAALVDGTPMPGYGPGNSAYFVHQMAQWIKTHNVAYHIYWDNFRPPGYSSMLEPMPGQPGVGYAYPFVSPQYLAEFGGPRPDLAAAPLAPTTFQQGVTTTNSMVLNWTPAPNGAAAQEYVILYRPYLGPGNSTQFTINIGQYLSGLSTSATLRNLPSQTQMEIYIQALNQGGQSGGVGMLAWTN